MIASTTLDPLTQAHPESPAEAEPHRAEIVALQAGRGGELWGLARHLALSPDEADDALQETLIRLWTALRDRSDPAVPVTLALRLGGRASWMPVDVPAGGVSPVPPCLGSEPTTLSVTSSSCGPSPLPCEARRGDTLGWS